MPTSASSKLLYRETVISPPERLSSAFSLCCFTRLYEKGHPAYDIFANKVL